MAARYATSGRPLLPQTNIRVDAIAPAPAAPGGRRTGETPSLRGRYPTNPKFLRYSAATASGSCLSTTTRALSSCMISSVMYFWTFVTTA